MGDAEGTERVPIFNNDDAFGDAFAVEVLHLLEEGDILRE